MRSVADVGRKWELIDLPQVKDERGSLGFAEEGRHIPFAVKRIFYLHSLPPGVRRGGHAHRRQHQMLVMLHGQCLLAMDDGCEVSKVELASPATALYVPPLVWLDLSDFTPGAVCLVLVSDVYDEDEYIRDYEQFRALAARS